MINIKKFFAGHKYAAMGVLLAVLIVCIIITAVHFYSGKDDSNIPETIAADNSENYVVSRPDKGTLSGDSTFLVLCTDETDKDIVFLTLLSFKVYSEKIIVTVLDENTLSGGKSYGEVYDYGGIDMLSSAVEKVRNIRIDRYAVLSRKGFISLVDNFGKVNQYIEEGYTYQSSDKSYEVGRGENELEGAMLFTYLKLIGNKSGGEKSVSAVLCDIINTYLGSLKDSDTLEMFGDVCNCLNTDLTVADYYSAENDIKYLLSHNTVCEAE